MEGESRYANLRFYNYENASTDSAVSIEELDKFAQKSQIQDVRLDVDDGIELLEFEEQDMTLFECAFVPEVVTRHPDFFSALSLIDLNVVGNKTLARFCPHQRRFNLLDTVMFMTGPGGHILGFDVPPLGCEFMRESMIKNMSMYNGDKVIGDSEDVCYGVREKIDGTEAVVFRVRYETTEEFYLWDSDRIMQVKASQPFHAEKVGDRYYILSPICGTFVFSTINDSPMNYVIHDFKTFHRHLYDNSREGLVFNINFREYKVCRQMSFTFKVEKNVAMDSTKKMVFAVTDLKDGCYDFVFERDRFETRSLRYNGLPEVNIKIGEYKGEDLYFLKRRDDRIYGDSFQHIEVTREKCVTYGKIVNYLSFETRSEVLIGIPMYFRDSTGVEVEYDEKSLPVIMARDRECISSDTFVGKHMLIPKFIGKDFDNFIQERTYFANINETLLVAQFVVPKKKDKNYVSWSDCFLAFHKYCLIHRQKVKNRLIQYSNEFDETDFFRFCVDRCLYLKDGMAYDLCMYKVMMQKGFRESVHGKTLYVSKVRRKQGRSYAYRQFFVWFDRPQSVSPK